MADIDHLVYAQSEQQPIFAREVSRTQNGNFRIRLYGEGWWRRFALIYRGLSLTEARAVKQLQVNKSGDTFTFNYGGSTETGRFYSVPEITELAPGNYQVVFDVLEDRVARTGSGTWPFTVADRSSRFIPSSGIAFTESISGVADAVNVFKKRESGQFIWVSEWISASEYTTFRNAYNSLQDEGFDIVWPLDSETYTVWFGENAWSVEQNAALYRVTSVLERQKQVNSGSDYYRTEGGDFYRTEGGDRYLVE